jgi:uncharacterized RDD family membrane protein YckC
LIIGFSFKSLLKDENHKPPSELQISKPLSLLQVLLRETVGKSVSGTLMFGYMWAFVDKKHQAFHDILAQTIVVEF